jgi:hypothetical protein
LKELLEAEHRVRSDPTRWQEGVDAIGKVLRDYKAGSDTQSPPWSPAYFAMLAARTSFSRGDWIRARELLTIGLKLDPRADDLLYLTRILEREQPASAALRVP